MYVQQEYLPVCVDLSHRNILTKTQSTRSMDTIKTLNMYHISRRTLSTIYIFLDIFVNDNNSVTSCNSNGVHTKTEMLTSNPQKKSPKTEREKSVYIHSVPLYCTVNLLLWRQPIERAGETERSVHNKSRATDSLI